MRISPHYLHECAGITASCFNIAAGVFIHVFTLGFHHIIQGEGARTAALLLEQVAGALIQHLHTWGFCHIIYMNVQRSQLHCFNPAVGVIIQVFTWGFCHIIYSG